MKCGICCCPITKGEINANLTFGFQHPCGRYGTYHAVCAMGVLKSLKASRGEKGEKSTVKLSGVKDTNFPPSVQKRKGSISGKSEGAGETPASTTNSPRNPESFSKDWCSFYGHECKCLEKKKVKK